MLEPGPMIRAAVDSLYRSPSRAALAGLASELEQDYTLRIPVLGLEVVGRDTVLAFLRESAPIDAPGPIIGEIVIQGSFAVAFAGWGAGAPHDACHVFSLREGRLASCCVISAPDEAWRPPQTP